MMIISTPHIKADSNAFGDTVLMPGDPMRSKYVAENFLSNSVLVNNIRGVQGYTGYYKDKKVSVMASGMGIPSIGIYSYELFNKFNVNNIIRIGSAGALSENLNLFDVVLGMGVCYNSVYANQYHLTGTFSPITSFDLLNKAFNVSKSLNVDAKVGNILSSDIFYDDNEELKKWQKMGVLAVEMESASLYMNAAVSGKNALTICTVSDILLRKGGSCTSEEREKSFNKMIEIALETA